MSTLQTLNPADIVSREMQIASMMPSNLQTLMTEKELVDLMEYMQSLKKAPL
jgi:hypothetical protein